MPVAWGRRSYRERRRDRSGRSAGRADPAPARRACARSVTFFVIPVTAVPTQEIGLGCVAHDVTSLPPIDTVMRPICPRWAARNASAAASCVVVGYSTAPAVWGKTSGHPIEETSRRRRGPSAAKVHQLQTRRLRHDCGVARRCSLPRLVPDRVRITQRHVERRATWSSPVPAETARGLRSRRR